MLYRVVAMVSSHRKARITTGRVAARTMAVARTMLPKVAAKTATVSINVTTRARLMTRTFQSR